MKVRSRYNVQLVKRSSSSLLGLILVLVVPVFIALGIRAHSAEALTANSVYITPTPISVKSGDSFAVSVRINPGTAIDGVQSTISYDTTKLQYSSLATDSFLNTTVFSLPILPLSASAGKISFAVGNLSQNISTDSLVATLKFKALVSTGTTDLTMTTGTTASSTNATSNGAWTNPSVIKATVNFTSNAAATCPTGQTGTPPNCVTPVVPKCPTGQTGTYPNCIVPPKPTCATGQTGTYPNCVTPACTSGQIGTYPNCVTVITGTSTKKCPTDQTGTYPNCVTPQPTTSTIKTTPPSVSIPVVETPKTVTNEKTAPTAPNLSIDNVQVQFTQATVTVSTDTPTRAYIQYGTTTEFGQKTSLSDLATTHQLALDPSTLAPGQTYYYNVIAEDTNGDQTQTSTQTITTRGMYLRLHVTDKDGQPIRNTTVTLHSTPVTAKTDNNGYVVFNNVTPGAHKLEYSSGLQMYVQPLTVASTILTTSGDQSTIQQDYTIRYPISQSKTMSALYGLIVCLVIVIIAIVAYVIILKARKNKSSQSNFVPEAAVITPLDDRARDLYFSSQQPPTNQEEGQDPWQMPPQK